MHATATSALCLAENFPTAFGARARDLRRLDAFLARGIAQALRLDREINHGYPLKYLPDQPYFRTIEIGAGSGGHLEFEDLSRQEYHCVELRENMSAEIERRFAAVTVMTGSCQDRMPYANNYFDRAIAVHVLEHLPDLPRAIGELHRLLRVGGILAIVIPCDPGVAYEFARQISSARIFRHAIKCPICG